MWNRIEIHVSTHGHAEKVRLSLEKLAQQDSSNSAVFNLCASVGLENSGNFIRSIRLSVVGGRRTGLLKLEMGAIILRRSVNYIQ